MRHSELTWPLPFLNGKIDVILREREKEKTKIRQYLFSRDITRDKFLFKKEKDDILIVFDQFICHTSRSWKGLFRGHLRA